MGVNDSRRAPQRRLRLAIAAGLQLLQAGLQPRFDLGPSRSGTTISYSPTSRTSVSLWLAQPIRASATVKAVRPVAVSNTSTAGTQGPGG